MKHFTALLLTGSLFVSLTGCTAYRHHKAGDAAATSGDMHAAVYHYEQALTHKDRLARDGDFLTKLSTARSRVAYDEAQRLRSLGRYEPALDQLRESMRQDASYREPAELLPVVLKEAARWRYDQAVSAADHGNLQAARNHLSRSMQHDLADESAAYAMASLTPSKLPEHTPGLAEYQAGLSLIAQRHWDQAEQSLVQSITVNSGLLPPRAALHEARTQLAESRRLLDQAKAAMDQRQVGPAIDALNQSLAIWPDHRQSSELLAHAKAQRALADKHFAAATQHAADAKWDDAITATDSGLAIDQSHQALNELHNALPRRAAAHYTHQGDAHLGKGDLDPAYESYDRALSYRATYFDARQGMAQVYANWGAVHEQAQRFGAALLTYTKGQSFATIKALDEGVVRTGAALRDRLGMGLSVSVNEPRRGEVDPRQLSDALTGTLLAHQTQGLGIQGQGMPYELRLSITQADIDQQLASTSQRRHHYTTQESRHNPEYDRVLARLRHAERDYDRACRNYHNAAGHGHHSHHNEHDGHYNHHLSQIHSAQRHVDRLRRELSRTPHYINVTLHHDWDYVVETYTKTGQLSVNTELIDTASGKAVQQFTHQASFAQSDDRTLNANPSVGVGHDDLNLHSDDYIRRAMTDELAQNAGPWAINAAIDHRLALINASIDLLESQGKTDEVLEARVDAAVLLGIVDRKGWDQSIQTLAKRYTR